MSCVGLIILSCLCLMQSTARLRFFTMNQSGHSHEIKSIPRLNHQGPGCFSMKFGCCKHTLIYSVIFIMFIYIFIYIDIYIHDTCIYVSTSISILYILIFDSEMQNASWFNRSKKVIYDGSRNHLKWWFQVSEIVVLLCIDSPSFIPKPGFGGYRRSSPCS